MISQSEERRIASLLGIDVTVIDHDYVLGCYLAFLCQHPEVHASWAFKGGTSLAKCHFSTYRFSEDLDFTAKKTVSPETLLAVVDHTNTQLQEHTGIRTDEVSPKVETVLDDYGKESFEVRIYYRGPWDHGGSAPSLQIHVNRDELLAFPVVERPLYHGYSDRISLPQGTITAYVLEEILAEKLRAFSGQRKRPIARDIFDIQHLLRHGANAEAVRGVFAAKCRVKGIDVMSLDVRMVLAREEEYRRNWERNVEYLVPSSLRIPFEVAWQVAIAELTAVLRAA
jgi:predicted nucleotidyltransferase component of viral defense system